MDCVPAAKLSFSCIPWKTLQAARKTSGVSKFLQPLAAAEPSDQVAETKCVSTRSQRGYFHHQFCSACGNGAKQEPADLSEQDISPSQTIPAAATQAQAARATWQLPAGPRGPLAGCQLLFQPSPPHPPSTPERKGTVRRLWSPPQAARGSIPSSPAPRPLAVAPGGAGVPREPWPVWRPPAAIFMELNRVQRSAEKEPIRKDSDICGHTVDSYFFFLYQ